MLVGRMPHTTTELKDCVSVEEYAHMCKLSKIAKLVLLAGSTFQLLQATSIMTLFATAYKELMTCNTLSQEVEYLKARYRLIELKVAGYERELSDLSQCMDPMYPFLDEMELRGAHAALADWVVELEGLLEEENKDFHEEELTH